MRRLLLVFLIIIILIPGCNSGITKDNKTTYRKVVQSSQNKQNALSNTDESIDMSNIDNNTSSTPSSTEPSITVEYKDPIILTDSKNNTVDFGNLAINNKINSMLCLVCPDIENNITYYVNYGKDDFIYQLKDGESSLILAEKTHHIQLWKNDLYFLGFKETEQYYNNIYKYNLITKKVELVVEAVLSRMYINSEGIYYTHYVFKDDNIKFIPCKLSWDTMTVEQFDKFDAWPDFQEYNDYILKYSFIPNSEAGNMHLQLIQKDTEECVFSENGIIYTNNTCIYKDYLCYTGRDKYLYVVNLLNGQVYTIGLGEFLGDMLTPKDYAIINDQIYITPDGSSYVYWCNLTDSTLKRIRLRNIKINDLFISGDRLFAVENKLAILEYELVELIPENDNITIKEFTP
jgi:uncharacterized lipoprotein YehR (DUF1307 family)